MGIWNNSYSKWKNRSNKFRTYCRNFTQWRSSKTWNTSKEYQKYRYTIRITNEGEIEGYATEITDYIPEGLKFVKEDNPDWYEKEDGTVGTRALEGTLLKPGESAEVQIILTWINGNENFGKKVNLAEISEDKNDSNTPDIDSTPDNRVLEEDDIDNAEVVLVISTGTAPTYIALTTTVLTIMSVGIILIKKYVLL